MSDAAPASRVVDASALLAYLLDEPGSEVVESLSVAAVISTVNWVEVVERSLDRGTDVIGMREEVEELGVTVTPFAVEDAERAARLRQRTRAVGLSLGDRACLALASRLGVPAITADRAWLDLDVGIEIVCIR